MRFIEVKNASGIGKLVIFVFPSAMYASRGYRKEMNTTLTRMDGKKVDVRRLEVKTPMALGILFNCVPNRYEPRGYRKEVNSIVPKSSEEKGLCTEKLAWKDSVTTEAVFIHHQGYGKG